MPTDTIQTEKFDASVARTWEATRRRETLLGAAGLMIWTGVFIALVVGTLVYDAGWIPEDYAVLTGEYGVFRGAKTKVYAAIVLVIIVMRWLRFRALVHDDARAERTANVAGIAFGALFLLALLAGLTALYGTFASPLVGENWIRPVPTNVRCSRTCRYRRCLWLILFGSPLGLAANS